MKKILVVAIGLLLTILVVLWNYFQPNEQVVSISDEPYLVIGDEIYSDSNYIIFDQETIYIPFDVIKEHIDSNLFYDDSEEMLIFTDEQKVIRYTVDSTEATVNHKKFYINNPIKKIEGKVYIPEEILYSLYDLEIVYWEDTNAVTIDSKDLNYLSGLVILEGGDIRHSFSRKSPILLKDVPVETELIVFEEYKDWYKVRTMDGIIGYIEKDYLKVNLTNNINRPKNEREDGYKKVDKKINLTWDYIHSKVTTIGNIVPILGVNVVSPTWFSILNEKAEIQDKANRDYLSQYKRFGYQIWPLINNGFDPDRTSKLLSSSRLRENLIEKIARLYSEYGVDGINIDFENVYMKDKDLLTQFVRELYPVFKEKGMVVSIDVTPISVSENWSLCYDRKELSKAVDYMILMAYDQHWADSPVAGSVAQYTWVEESLKAVLKEVYHEKIILGVPFYTRLWTIKRTDKGEEVSSKALSMDDANKFIEENNIELVWHEESGQYYGEVSKGNITYKIWVEDVKSLELKSSLVNKYDLAGIASWREGFEKDEIWPAISNTINLN